MSNSYNVVQFSDFKDLAKEDERFAEVFESMLASFSNNGINKDVETFIKKKAEQFDNMNMAKTYLVMDKGLNEICGYYSIVSKSITIKQRDWGKLSKSVRKKLNPFGYKDTSSDQNIPAILLGQLGRNFNADNKISGNELLSLSFETIKSISSQIGGRYLYLEADDTQKLTNFYTNHGFSYLSFVDGSCYKTKNNQVMFIKKMND
ncbi:hypothetical protein [Convivina intestini]|uniref:hypothetical protein n=1 Tax=Convivina intestini TaxID=1505726 RepID=UPI00200FF78F|nr:hypothetical protein [Convivina intestini]CAH1853144.1 hypothetical protein R078131_00652 [Convivina intestini]